jgi:hypothetical protein
MSKSTLEESENDEVMVVRILGVDYSVEEDSSLAHMGLQGLISFTDQRILINENISFEMQRSAILHEIIEGINGMLEMKLKHNQISQMEAGLNQVLSDNPLLFNLWTYEEEDASEEEGE